MNTLLNRTLTLVLTNKTNATVDYGTVVALDSSVPSSLKLITGTSAYTASPLGVVLEPLGIAANAQGSVGMSGYVPQINLDGFASLGHFVKTSTTGGQATPHATEASGDFGAVLTTGTTPAATLFGFTNQGGGGLSAADHFIVGSGGQSDTDLSAKIIIPGLSGSPDIRVAGTNDDEFDAALSGWTQLGTLDTSNTSDRVSHYHAKRTQVALVLDGIYKACPSIPFTMTAKLSASLMYANYMLGGIMIGEAAPGKLNVLGVYYDSALTQGLVRLAYNTQWTNRTTYVTNTPFNIPMVLPIYLQIIVHSSTNVDYAFSFDGILFNIIAAAVNPGFTVGSVGLCINDFAFAHTSEAYFDWVRFT